MKFEVILVIQARMGSKRLPGKSLMSIGGKPMITRIIEKVLKCKNLDKIILAIPDTYENNKLAMAGEEMGIEVFRGSENDLIDRYYCAVEAYKPSIVGRLPADNPLPEPREIDRIIGFHKRSKFTFTSNLSEVFNNGYPDGIGAEMIDFSALETIWKERHVNNDSKLKEHIHLNFFDYTSQQIVDKRFSVGTINCPKEFSRPEIVLDINTIQDLRFINSIFEFYKHKKPTFDITDIIFWYDNFFLPSKI